MNRIKSRRGKKPLAPHFLSDDDEWAFWRTHSLLDFAHWPVSAKAKKNPGNYMAVDRVLELRAKGLTLIPSFRSDKEEARWWETHQSLSGYSRLEVDPNEHLIPGVRRREMRRELGVKDATTDPCRRRQ